MKSPDYNEGFQDGVKEALDTLLAYGTSIDATKTALDLTYAALEKPKPEPEPVHEDQP